MYIVEYPRASMCRARSRHALGSAAEWVCTPKRKGLVMEWERRLSNVATTKPRVIEDIKERGYAVIEDAATPAQVQAVKDGLAPYLDHGPHGRNDFEGFKTQRVYTLPAKTRAFDPMIEHPDVLA